MTSKFAIILTATIFSVSPLVLADYADEVKKDSPLAWYRFAESQTNDGGAVKDSAGRHDGVFRGRCVSDKGPDAIGGSALRLDGKTAYAEIPHHKDFDLAELSVEFWFKSAQAWDAPAWPFSATLVTKATAGANSSDWTINGGSRAGGEGGRVVALVGAKSMSGDLRLESRRAPLNDGQWHHVVWTRSAGGENGLYVDGRLHAAGQDGGGGIVNQRPIQIGGDAREKGTFLDGWMAEVAIYRTLLSGERVKGHFQAGGGQDRPAADRPQTKILKTLVLSSKSHLAWELAQTAEGWALGTARLNGKPADQPLLDGVLRLRNTKSGKTIPLPAQRCEQVRPCSARLAGAKKVGDSTVTFEVGLALRDDMPLAALTATWSLDKDLADYELCIAWHDVGAAQWRCTLYPFAGNAPAVSRKRLTFVGVPAALLFKDDLSLVTLFGIDPACDYLNPTTWTGATGFAFEDQETPPQFRVGGGKLQAGVDYRMPMQVLLSDAGDSAAAISQLVRGWIAANDYKVQPLHVRTPQEGFDLFLDGRRASRMWRPGFGYQIMDIWKVVYTAESPINAWFDYQVYEQTKEEMWRRRALATMDWMLKAQHTDPADPHFGAIDTNYELDTGQFTSRDHSPNWRYKVDMHAYAAHYMLLLWERVKQKEGLDRKDWRQAAVRIADWLCRQQNPDGGLPQVVDNDPKRKSISVVSGRALVAMPAIARITGDAKYARLAVDLETFLRTRCEGRYWFTGSHVDLWPKDFESDSIWHAVEYWLGQYERTGRRECLDRARADAYFAFLMWCPRQLSWVASPTQTCHAEQENFLQYSNYNYNNRKYQCLSRLGRHTGDKLFADLCERIIQCGLWAQATDGPWKGGQHERMSDPWLGVSKDVNSKGAVYVSELALEANLQFLEMGLARPKPAPPGWVEPKAPPEPQPAATSPPQAKLPSYAGWVKHPEPVLGGPLGTCFDVSVLREGQTYRMWFSWRPKASVALTESTDGIHWSPPRIVLAPLKATGWEDDINRPVVLKKGDTYHIWYTGFNQVGSSIGCATSPDGRSWKRMSDKPVLVSQKPWEKQCVMCPHVLWDEREKIWKMWYSAGERGEPNAIGCATSPDGLAWTRHPANPIFVPDPASVWEKHKVTACQVEKRGNWYVMFYIGFATESYAQIGLARSRDGITGWERHKANPIIRPDPTRWDHDACYKPYAIFDGRRWLLWYNGRKGGLEQIGLATHEGEDLGF